MSAVPGLPTEIVASLERLLQAGFQLTVQRGDGNVNRTIEMQTDMFGLRLVADRGQWWIEGGPLGQGDWFDADVWRSCLEERPASFDPSPFAEQVEYFCTQHEAMAEAARDADLAQRLVRSRARRARERLGLPPTVEGGYE